MKVPDASEPLRCAPPHTFGAGEEPCREGGAGEKARNMEDTSADDLRELFLGVQVASTPSAALGDDGTSFLEGLQLLQSDARSDST